MSGTLPPRGGPTRIVRKDGPGDPEGEARVGSEAGTPVVPASPHQPFTLPATQLPATQLGGDDSTGRILHERYELTRRLGRGGMGEVWRALHLGLGSEVAVKMIHGFLAKNAEESKRFVHEAHALSLLSHPNVVRVLDFGREGETQFLVMELLQGQSLGARIEETPGLLPLADVADVVTQITDALEAVHAIGIVHRDLKPENVFLTEDLGGRTRVKVVDFGLAHVDDPRDETPLTVTGTLAGTPQYMSPEQCRSLRVGPSADLYSLGCILTEMLQRRPPFSGNTTVDIITRHLFTPPPALSRPEGAEPVPPLLERLRLDLLAKTPDRRPASAREVRERLEVAMDPVRAELSLPDRSGAHAEPRFRRASSWPAPSHEPAPVVAGTVRITRAGAPPVLDELMSTALESRSYRCVGEDEPCDVLVLDAASVADAEAWFLGAAERPPTIVCVRSASVEAISRLVAAGASAVLLHPVGPDALLKKLDSLMRRRRR